MKLALIDRDGVLNEDRLDYVKSPAELVVIPEAAAGLALLSRGGFTCCIVTNQAAVGKGIIDQAMLDAIHAKLTQAIEAEGGKVAEIFFCTDHPDRPTARRKPGAGMLLEALARYEAVPAKTPMIGDTVTDMLAAKAAGCARYLVMTGKGADSERALPESVRPVEVCRDILDAAGKIVNSWP